MSGSANVQRIDVISDFANGMRAFREDAASAVMAIEQQVNRALAYIQHDAPMEARLRIRKCEQRVSKARAALETAKVKNAGTGEGEGSSLYDEQKALDVAKKRLEAAREKHETIKRWGNAAQREVDEFRGRIGALKHQLDADVPKAIAMLERTRASLERYLERQIGAGGDSGGRAAGAFLDQPAGDTKSTDAAATDTSPPPSHD